MATRRNSRTRRALLAALGLAVILPIPAAAQNWMLKSQWQLTCMEVAGEDERASRTVMTKQVLEQDRLVLPGDQVDGLADRLDGR